MQEPKTGNRIQTFQELVGFAMEKSKYNFDEVIDRHNTGSEKWDFLKERFGSSDLLPLWVADMDFKAPQPIIDAVESRARHGIYGYSDLMQPYYDSVINWYSRRYGWHIQREWLVFTPGVIPAINTAVAGLSNIGDKIIVQPPVYYPFFRAIESNGRHVLYNPLRLIGDRYEMDFEDLEQKVKDPRAKMLILCSPHNPIGRVWNKDELKRLGEICIENGILVVSDEIHSDITYPGIVHTNFASISGEFADNSITCTSASKTFNLAGLQISNIIIPNKKIRSVFKNTVESSGLTFPNSFAPEAVRAAYDECEDWLEEFLNYLKGNLEFLKAFVKENIPSVNVIEPEGTYLCWLDFRKIERDSRKLENIILNGAKVALDEGYIFRSGGEGFERINLACPRSILKRALNQIADAVRRAERDQNSDN